MAFQNAACKAQRENQFILRKQKGRKPGLVYWMDCYLGNIYVIWVII